MAVEAAGGILAQQRDAFRDLFHGLPFNSASGPLPWYSFLGHDLSLTLRLFLTSRSHCRQRLVRRNNARDDGRESVDATQLVYARRWSGAEG